MTLVAGDGPLFVTVKLKTTLLEAITVLGEAVWVKPMSANGLTTIATEAELLFVARSRASELATAVLVKVPGEAGRTVNDTVAMALLAITPKLQVTSPLFWLTLPCDGEEEMKANPGGS